jgi:AraC-like DNA-binding protein
LFRSALALTGRRDLAVEFAREVRPDTFDALGYALMSCRDLGEAIALVPLYRRVVFDAGYSETVFSVGERSAKLAWVVLPQAAQAGSPYCELLAESLVASWFKLGCWIAGTELPLREVRFAHAAPDDRVPFERFFDCPVRFACGENALLFDRELLGRPLTQADAALNLVMREQARRIIEQLQGEPGLAGQVRQILMRLMPRCEATLPRVAAQLALTPRTLQRRLDAGGLAFHALLGAARRELALLYLRDPALSVLDVALLLGYAEQSSFTRAFRVWFGVAPSVWRAGQAHQPVGDGAPPPCATRHDDGARGLRPR